jgi:hypothetical protein
LGVLQALEALFACCKNTDFAADSDRHHAQLALSRRQHGFDSRWGRHLKFNDLRLAF